MTKISQWVTTMASETPGSTVSLVGQGSFLDKPSLHMVGYMGKVASDFNTAHDGWCPVCKSKGHSQALKTYRINFTQSIFLCSNPQCIFPLGYTPLDNIIANTVDLQKHPNASKSQKRAFPETSPAPLACVKRPKTDLPIVGDLLARNDRPSTESGLSESVEVFPTSRNEITPPRTLQNGYVHAENASRAANSFSSFTPGLYEKPTSSDVPGGLHIENIVEPSKDKGMIQELSSNEIPEMHVQQLSETDHMGSSGDNDQSNFTLTEIVVPNGELSPLEKCVFSPDHLFFSTPLPARVVSCGKDNSPKAVSSANYVPNIERALVMESVFHDSFETIQKSACEKLEDIQSSPQPEEIGTVFNADCAGTNQPPHRTSPARCVIENAQTITSEGPVSEEVQAYEANQEIHSGSNLETSPENAVKEDMGDSPSGHGSSQDIEQTSQSLWDFHHIGSTEDNDFEMYELTKASVQNISVELSVSSLENCTLSLQKHSDGDVEKSLAPLKVEGHPVPVIPPQLNSISLEPQNIVKECQTSPDATHVPGSLQGIISECPSVAAVEDKSSVNSSLISLQEHCSSEDLDLVHDCPKDEMIKASLQGNQSVCHKKISGIHDHADSALSDNSLSEPENVISDSPNIPYVTSTPCRAVPSAGDSSKPVVNGFGTIASTDDNDKTTKVSLLSDNLMPDIHMDMTTIAPNSPKSKMLAKESHLVFCAGANIDDLDVTKIPLVSNDGLSTPQGVKKTNENPVLPDLLLDIQPDRWMEKPLSATQNPTCPDSATKHLEDVDGKQKQHEDTLSETSPLETTMNNESVMEDNSVDTTTKQDSMASLRTFQNSQRRLQWSNKHSLCWLDCILSALVQSAVISSVVEASENKEPVIHYLLARYEEANAMVPLCDKKKSGGTKKFEKHLNDVRMYIFDKLKPLLKCELGQKESPVFAFPLLLKQDPVIENLYKHSFTWDFKCDLCGYSYQTSCQKTITTFTKIVPDWHPLNAAHTSPCNKCQNANQRRAMRLEKLQHIFMVHFVEGLPTNDLQKYSFQFKNHLYEIKAVIRYRSDHFSTWIANDDGTWLESDDLKGSFCRRHQKFKVRAEDIHVVMWERSNAKVAEKEDSHVGPAECQLGPAECQLGPAPSTTIPDQTLPQTSLSPKQVAPAAQPANLNASNPLAGMEGYADDDIITLTLVEVPVDAMGNPIDPDPPIPAPKEAAIVVQPQPPVQIIVPNTFVMLPKHDNPNQDVPPPVISSHSKAKPVPTVDCNIQQSAVSQSNVTKPVSNMKAPAASSPFLQPFNVKKSVVGSFMANLIKKDRSFLNGSPGAANKSNAAAKPSAPLKITDLSGSYKSAQNFDGFQAKRVNKVSNALPAEAANMLSVNPQREKPTQSLKSFLAPAASGHLKTGTSGFNYSKVRDDGSSSEDRIRKLRLKLLKKLKSKKNELAVLEKMAKRGSSIGDHPNPDPQGGFNRRQHIDGFLQELQDHIDNADNESVCTASSCTSICSSPGDAEFFAELFSPSPVDNPASDGRYLEMLADGFGISTAQHTNGHSFPMDSNCSQQATSGNNSFQKASALDCSNGDESLNIMSSSTLAMVNAETEYFPSFDYMF